MHGQFLRRGFTLIELLVVIAIIAILAVVVVLTLNPAQLLAQSRDASRVSDMATLNSALGLYQTDSGGKGFMGTSTVVYVSLPDNASSTCGSIGLPALPPGYIYNCSPSSSTRLTNGVGWIPLDFTKMSSGAPFGSIPVDPVNSSSSGLYYAYVASGTQYMVTSIPESTKQKQALASNPIIPNIPDVIANGSSLVVNPIFNAQGLVGYWPMDEGLGSIVFDQSGNGNKGSFVGSPVWNFGTACKLGNACIDFPAGTNYISVPDASNLDIVNNLTISMWIKMVTLSPSGGSTHPIAKWSGTSDANYVLYYCGSACGSGSTYDWYGNAGGVWSWIVGGTSSIISADGQWHQISLTYSSGGVFYWDGVSVATKTSQGNLATSAAALKIGMDGGSGDEWVLDDVRVYNRSLSAAEIRALYNAGK